MRQRKTMQQIAAEGVFKLSTMQRWRFDEASNGAREYGVFVQIGKRVYIDIENLEKWIASGVSSMQGRAA